jgi:iron-sulfur cluster insertion protein|tara:strand:- start:653 stop:967 length:315 start_codon:yes stop_codon:yes gene_type:complete
MEKKLEFTDRAKNQIKKITKSEEKKYFRIAVQGGGCSGYKYNFSFDNNLEKDDILFDRTIIDKASLEIISGSTVDFKKEMIGESFTINNPKATSSCGCGLSFSA